jgi:hypothetical protein
LLFLADSDRFRHTPEQTSQTSGLSNDSEHGESIGVRPDTAVLQPEDMPLDLGGNYQWQLPVGSDMLGAGLMFNWDQSIDLIAGGFGMDMYQ